MAEGNKDLVTSKKVLKEIQSLKTEINKQSKIDISSTEDIIDKATDYLKTIQAIAATEKENAALKKSISDFSEQINDSASQLSKETKQYYALQLRELKAQEDQSKALLKQFKIKKDTYELTEDQIKLQEKLAKFNKKYNETIKDSLSFIDDITEKIGNIPVVGDVLVKALGADQLKEKLADKVTGALAGVETAGISLLPILVSIGAAFALIKFSVDINKETTELARNLGKSNKEARVLRKEMADISVNSENALMSIKNQTVAMEALATEAGTNKIISKDLIFLKSLLLK